MDLQIEERRIDIAPEWRADIESRVADLRPGRDITHVRATLSKLDHRKTKGFVRDVHVVVQIPGHTLAARKHKNSFEEAIRLAFSAMETALDKVREKRVSHEIRTSAPPERGIVSRVSRADGYGFISTEDGIQVYFHRNAVRDCPLTSSTTEWKSV
jgi:ribosomal subunit interface protein